jgi:hypothetical protein
MFSLVWRLLLVIGTLKGSHSWKFIKEPFGLFSHFSTVNVFPFLEPGLFLYFGQSAFPIRIRIQDSQMKADPGGSGSGNTTLNRTMQMHITRPGQLDFNLILLLTLLLSPGQVR